MAAGGAGASRAGSDDVAQAGGTAPTRTNKNNSRLLLSAGSANGIPDTVEVEATPRQLLRYRMGRPFYPRGPLPQSVVHGADSWPRN